MCVVFPFSQSLEYITNGDSIYSVWNNNNNNNNVAVPSRAASYNTVLVCIQAPRLQHIHLSRAELTSDMPQLVVKMANRQPLAGFSALSKRK
jgi:hypothetical protein